MSPKNDSISRIVGSEEIDSFSSQELITPSSSAPLQDEQRMSPKDDLTSRNIPNEETDKIFPAQTIGMTEDERHIIQVMTKWNMTKFKATDPFLSEKATQKNFEYLGTWARLLGYHMPIKQGHENILVTLESTVRTSVNAYIERLKILNPKESDESPQETMILYHDYQSISCTGRSPIHETFRLLRLYEYVEITQERGRRTNSAYDSIINQAKDPKNSAVRLSMSTHLIL